MISFYPIFDIIYNNPSILIDFLMYVDRIIMELSILYFKGLQVKVSKSKIFFYL